MASRPLQALRDTVFRARMLSRTLRNAHRHQRGVCDVCGERTLFLVEQDNLKESLTCVSCGAWLRLRFLARELARLEGSELPLAELVRTPGMRRRRIWEAQASGPLHTFLATCPRYACSEFLEGVERGSTRNGVRCEDMQDLTWPDGDFDLVLHSSVLEHVRRPREALAECHRILAPGGLMLFEVPLTDLGAPEMRSRTVARVDTSGPKDVPLLEPVHHGDPLRPGGALVYHDFGLDLRQDLEALGFEVDLRSMPIPDSTMSHVAVWICRKLRTVEREALPEAA